MQEQRRIEALLECYEFAEIDLLKPADKAALAKRMRDNKQKDAKDEAATKRRKGLLSGAWKWVVAAICGMLVNTYGPEAFAWLKSLGR